ncbi:hypothetical protein AMS59_04040 [Lysinibacillus sp. FJAT-14745]|uniref:hypothetical protein n=1 Tax=Lysinibacillus sp. FJAT-14745 TaxID=1704289 RepID=UPI0006ABABE2|nr:hypothetical protein [Lysinibacillus sp. FJAT-14745]KOP80561.1 hypothetical protein AMS59_04040 [Lysinibacillus sp. FJAT-14745]
MCARRSDTIKKKMQMKRQTLHGHKCKKCSKYPCICCDKFFVLNLAGLTDNLNYELLRYKGQKAEIETVFCTIECGVICNIGIDFIEIKEQDGAIVTILKDKISRIYLSTDKDNGTFC